MADDNGLPQIEASSAAIHVAMLNTATILDTLAMILGVYHARLNLAIFFSVYLWPLSHKINLPSPGYGNDNLSSASSSLPAQPHHITEDDSKEQSLLSFPISVKWAHYID